MYELYQFEHLQSDHYCRFKTKFSITKVKHLLERRPQIIHDHNIAIALSSDIINLGNIYLLTNAFSFDKLGNELGLIK